MPAVGQVRVRPQKGFAPRFELKRVQHRSAGYVGLRQLRHVRDRGLDPVQERRGRREGPGKKLAQHAELFRNHDLEIAAPERLAQRVARGDQVQPSGRGLDQGRILRIGQVLAENRVAAADEEQEAPFSDHGGAVQRQVADRHLHGRRRAPGRDRCRRRKPVEHLRQLVPLAPVGDVSLAQAHRPVRRLVLQRAHEPVEIRSLDQGQLELDQVLDGLLPHAIERADDHGRIRARNRGEQLQPPRDQVEQVQPLRRLDPEAEHAAEIVAMPVRTGLRDDPVVRDQGELGHHVWILAADPSAEHTGSRGELYAAVDPHDVLPLPEHAQGEDDTLTPS